MVDITLCANKKCPIRENCYRFKATPNEYRQSYADYDFAKDGKCEYFVKINNFAENKIQASKMEDLVTRLTKRAEIRRQISTRKSVQEGQPDRISDLLEEAASEIYRLREILNLDIRGNPDENKIKVDTLATV